MAKVNNVKLPPASGGHLGTAERSGGESLPAPDCSGFVRAAPRQQRMPAACRRECHVISLTQPRAAKINDASAGSLVARQVPPALSPIGRPEGSAHAGSASWMRPDLFGKRLDGCLQFSARRGSAQQRTNHREPKAGPQDGGGWSRFFGHHISSKKVELRNYVRPYRSWSEPATCIFCGLTG